MLAELCRRDLVPAVWVASLADRAIRERLRRRAHLVKARTSARNRIFGLLTQFGLRISFTRLRQPDALELLERRGVPAVWRDSIAEHLDRDRRTADAGSRRSTKSSTRSPGRSQGPAASDDPGRRPADQPHLRLGDRRRLALLFGVEAGRLCRPRSADHPVGRALGHRAAIEGRLADASLGRRRGRQPGLATDQPVSRSLPATGGSPRKEPGEVGGRAEATDHLLAHALAQPGLFTNHCHGELLTLSGRLTALHGIERPRQLPGTICAASAEREMSSTQRTGSRREGGDAAGLTTRRLSKRKSKFEACCFA